MDIRKQLADDLLSILQRTVQAQSQALSQQDDDTPPLPGFLFDQIVALIKMLLSWLGVIEELSLDEYKQRVEQAKKNAAARSSESAGRSI